MSRRRLLAWLSLVPAFLLQALPLGLRAQATARPRRMALVIGNGKYAQVPLANPENDARLMAATMRELGFEVDLHYNLKRQEFNRVLRTFGQRMGDDDGALVFFYAGHGMQIDHRNYLLPVDLNLRDEGEIQDEAIDLEKALLHRIEHVRTRIFIVDACRDNPFVDRVRGRRVSKGLAEMAAPAGTLIAFSAAPGGTAEDGPPGTNSIYSRVLAREMRVEGLEVEQMLTSVRVKVFRETNERQLPFSASTMLVDFAFNPSADATSLAAVPPASSASAARPALSATPRQLRLNIRAERSLNTDQQQTSASLALRVYVLRDDLAFQRANFDSLYDNDEATLGAALLQRESLHLRPGETRDLVLRLGSEARLVAVFAAYREVEQSQWRTVLALPSDDLVRPLRLDAQARQVQLSWLQ